MARCRVCRAQEARLTPPNKLRYYCSYECMAKDGLKDAKKAEKEKDKAKLEVLNQTVSHWRPKADKAFQLFCRLRDYGKPCISCGCSGGQMHGGHYVSKGAKKTLTRYAEDNCHAQCATCNDRLSGNIALYRPALLEKIGQYRLGLLEGPIPLVHWKWDDYKRVYDWYNRLNKILKKEIKEASF